MIRHRNSFVGVSQVVEELPLFLRLSSIQAKVAQIFLNSWNDMKSVFLLLFSHQTWLSFMCSWIRHVFYFNVNCQVVFHPSLTSQRWNAWNEFHESCREAVMDVIKGRSWHPEILEENLLQQGRFVMSWSHHSWIRFLIHISVQKLQPPLPTCLLLKMCSSFLLSSCH